MYGSLPLTGSLFTLPLLVFGLVMTIAGCVIKMFNRKAA